MQRILDPERNKRMLTAYNSMKPIFQDLARLLPANTVLVDVGTGEGVIPLEIVNELRISHAHFVDVENVLAVELPKYVSFHRLDVCSDEFLNQFRGKASVVTSFIALHEFYNIVSAIKNIVGILANGGRMILFDFSEIGWRHQAITSAISGDKSFAHYSRDVSLMQRIGLNTNEGIVRFWKEKVASVISGQFRIDFAGEIYCVQYIAR